MSHTAKIIPSVVAGQAILRCTCGQSVFVTAGHGKYVCACGAVVTVKSEESVGAKVAEPVFFSEPEEQPAKFAHRGRRK